MWETKKVQQALLSLGIAFQRDEPMKKHTSFQVGGPATFFCLPHDEAQLVALLQLAKVQEIPHCVLGRGSNVLFLDEGYAGIVISLGSRAFSALENQGTRLKAGAALSLSQLCTQAQLLGLSGLEFAYGIPGTVAGATYMNAGAYGGEMCDVLSHVHFLDEELKRKTLPLSALDMAYRSSCFQQKDWVILGAELCLQEGSPAEILGRMQEISKQRKSKQPLNLPSAGSAFKRPQGAFAAALIEECGLKGKRVGDAAVSEKHSGFIVNLGAATCRDILTLADEVAELVHGQTGILLQREFQVIRE